MGHEEDMGRMAKFSDAIIDRIMATGEEHDLPPPLAVLAAYQATIITMVAMGGPEVRQMLEAKFHQMAQIGAEIHERHVIEPTKLAKPQA